VIVSTMRSNVYAASPAAGAADQATPVQPGTTDVTITVTVSYLIG
jgi:uncharacterized protein YggE